MPNLACDAQVDLASASVDRDWKVHVLPCNEVWGDEGVARMATRCSTLQGRVADEDRRKFGFRENEHTVFGVREREYGCTER